MEVIITMAGVASIPKVSGNSMAIVAEGPKPGNIPTIVPKKQPSVAIHKLNGVKIVIKP
jgi:hypothetical protein